MIRRSFLSTLAAWFPGSTLLARWQSPAVASESTPVEHRCPNCENRRFNVDLWNYRLECLIRERLPDVTFGEVALIPSGVCNRGVSYSELTPTNAVASPFIGNGMVFAQEVGQVGKGDSWDDIQTDLPFIDKCLSRSAVVIADRIRQMEPMLLSRARCPIVCQIKDLELIRLHSSLTTMIRGLVAVAPATPPAKL